MEFTGDLPKWSGVIKDFAIRVFYTYGVQRTSQEVCVIDQDEQLSCFDRETRQLTQPYKKPAKLVKMGEKTSCVLGRDELTCWGYQYQTVGGEIKNFAIGNELWGGDEWRSTVCRVYRNNRIRCETKGKVAIGFSGIAKFNLSAFGNVVDIKNLGHDFCVLNDAGQVACLNSQDPDGSYRVINANEKFLAISRNSLLTDSNKIFDFSDFPFEVVKSPKLMRVSIATGAEFESDNSNPELGEAYKDPSGLIWGRIEKKTARFDQTEAEIYCKNAGARLPTRKEFEQLARYLGYGSSYGYSTETKDDFGDIFDFLPNFVNRRYWSSTVDQFDPGLADFYYGGNGDIGTTFRSLRQAEAAICISGG